MWLLFITEELKRYKRHDIRLLLRHISLPLPMIIFIRCSAAAWDKLTFFFHAMSPAVKPHAPTNVKAVSRSSGVLMVTWEPPSLPTEGLQCQFQYHSPTVRAHPKWKVCESVYQNIANPLNISLHVIRKQDGYTEHFQHGLHLIIFPKYSSTGKKDVYLSRTGLRLSW